MKSEDPAANLLEKSGQRRPARRESVSPNSLPPAARRVRTAPLAGGLNPAAYLDDDYRRAAGAVLLEGTAPEDVAAPKLAVNRPGAPASIPPDGGSSLAGGDGRGLLGVRTPILPGGGLPRLGAGPINPMPRNPPAIERPGRFYRGLGGGIPNFPRLDDCAVCGPGPSRTSPDICRLEESLAAPRKSISSNTAQAKPCGGGIVD